MSAEISGWLRCSALITYRRRELPTNTTAPPPPLPTDAAAASASAAASSLADMERRLVYDDLLGRPTRDKLLHLRSNTFLNLFIYTHRFTAQNC
uniref:Uncharacterized protein n=1 Tax=Arundo donax TaxID=35708 RepID=A0A0A9GMB5_ARUDO